MPGGAREARFCRDRRSTARGSLLEHARTRVGQANLSAEFVLEDMRRFSRPATFDLIINFFTSFGYFVDQADDLRVLERVPREPQAWWGLRTGNGK